MESSIDCDVIRDDGPVGLKVVHMPGPGIPAGHRYGVFGPKHELLGEVSFQNGTVPEAGHNGVTNEALLEIVIHRTRVLNERFPCAENEMAIRSMQEALSALDARTARRRKVGIEGQHVEQAG